MNNVIYCRATASRYLLDDVIQYCRDYVHILDAHNDKYDLITQDQREFLKSDKQQRLTKYIATLSSPSCTSVKNLNKLLTNSSTCLQVRNRYWMKRAAQLREHLLDKMSNEPTDSKIILDGLVGFYSSPRGNLLKRKNYFADHAFCYGVLALVPGSKTACDYIVKPEKVLGGSLWHGQPHLRNDRTRVGLCPSCLESLVKMRIEARNTFLVKIRNSLASNKNSPHAKAAIEKEKQLTLELSSLQNDLEGATVAKLALVSIRMELANMLNLHAEKD